MNAKKYIIKKIILCNLGIIMIILSFAILKDNIVDIKPSWEFESAIVTIAFISYYIITWKIMKFKVVSLKFFILLSLNLFHIANIILIGLNLTKYDKYLMLYRYGEKNGFIATWYANLIIISYVIGLIIFSNRSKENISYDVCDPKELEITKKIGKLLFYISLFPTLYSNYVQIMAKVKGGYNAAMSVKATFYGIPLGWFTKLFLPSILLLMSGYRNDKKKCKRIMILTIFYYCIFMFFTGRKGNTVQILVPLICMYYYLFKPKIKISQIFFGYMIIYLMTIVTKSRKLSVTVDFWAYIKLLIIEANPITDLMLEMGGTVKAIIQVMLAVPKTGNFQFGLTYPAGIIYSILSDGLGISMNWLKKYANFSEYLSSPERGSYINNTVASMGGSCIAEWYWNFGWFAIPLTIIVSKLVLCYEKKIQLNLCNPTKFALLISFFYYFMRYTRGYIVDTIWDPIFIFLVVFVCYKIFKRNIRSEKNVSECNSSNV